MRIFRLILLNPTSILLSAVVCNAQKWEALNPPLNPFNGNIYSTIIDSGGSMYCAGDFTNMNNARFVAKWNGTSWNEVGSGSSSLNASNTILTLSHYAGTIYAAGGFI